MVKKCPECNKIDIDDKYKMCFKCLKGTGDSNKLIDLEFHLKHINWNLGLLQKYMKFQLIMELEKGGHEGKIRDKIYKELKKDLNKDFKAVKDIKDEKDK